jgi:hypothetical protein
MHKNTMKCNKTQIKWCINKHGASNIIDTLETYQQSLCHPSGHSAAALGPRYWLPMCLPMMYALVAPSCCTDWSHATIPSARAIMSLHAITLSFPHTDIQGYHRATSLGLDLHVNAWSSLCNPILPRLLRLPPHASTCNLHGHSRPL